jgi:hypothetical protein
VCATHPGAGLFGLTTPCSPTTTGVEGASTLGVVDREPPCLDARVASVMLGAGFLNTDVPVGRGGLQSGAL